MIARRAVLQGLIAAPLVARSGILMSIRGEVLDTYSIRWLAAYEIGTDQIIARGDVLYGMFGWKELPFPTKGVWQVVPQSLEKIKTAYKVPINEMVKRARDNPGQQWGFTTILRPHEAADHHTSVLG